MSQFTGSMPEERWNILLIEDDPDDYLLTRAILNDARQGRFTIDWQRTFESGLEAIIAQPYDVALLDYGLGEHSGVDLLQAAASRGCQVPVILLTGRGSYQVDLQAMQAGAVDYLNKAEVTPALLERSIRYAIERRQTEAVLLAQKQQLEWQNRQILESEERFRLTLSRTSIVVFTMDRDLRYTWVHNPPFGLCEKDFLGRTDEEILGEDAAGGFTALKRAVLESGTGQRREVVTGIGGVWLYFDMSIEPLHDAAGQVCGLTGAAVDMTQLRQLEARQVKYNTQVHLQRLLLENREQERLQIARDLHDGPIQDVIALIFAIDMAQQGSTDLEHIKTLREISAGAQKLVSELRSVCNQLRPPTLSQFGLARTIRSLAEEIHRRHPELVFQFELADDTHRLSDSMRLALYRIFQECLNNIIRHANAHRVSVRLQVTEDEAQLTVADDGRGFDVRSDDWTPYAQAGHLGLVGMKERAEAIGGTLQVQSSPGAGTQVNVIIPITYL